MNKPDLRLRSYLPKYFQAHEFASKRAYAKRGAQIFEQIDTKLLISADTLRWFLSGLTPETPEKGILTCNDWYYGGKRQFSGLRTYGDKYFRKFSAHSRGMAGDFISKHYDAETIRKHIIANKYLFPYITRIEGEVNWLHIDTTNLPSHAPKGAIEIFYKNKPSIYV
ncbi:hypothetical protein LZS85_15580 [Aliivibrio fischeri]|uniref:hypothetical protein n=1 Tax=Aliivibrio fischeri TaxID=668 RepID=UPI001F3DB3A1|nr:hypothetical protein [Aliivibrio fischeri]MCE7567544.1 hypothetical protein [Aliivibrio fischeri]